MLLERDELVLRVIEAGQRVAQLANPRGDLGELGMQLARTLGVGVEQIRLQHRERLLEQVAPVARIDEAAERAARRHRDLQGFERAGLASRELELGNLELLIREHHADRAEQLAAQLDRRGVHGLADGRGQLLFAVRQHILALLGLGARRPVILDDLVLELHAVASIHHGRPLEPAAESSPAGGRYSSVFSHHWHHQLPPTRIRSLGCQQYARLSSGFR